MNNKQKKALDKALVIAGIIILCFALIIWFYIKEQDTSNQANTSDVRTNQIARTYNKHQNYVRSTVLSHASSSNNSTIRALGTNNSTIDTVRSASNQFANVYCNWDNSSEYNGRKNKLSHVITPAVASSNLFHNDLDSTGGHSVDIEQLQESLIDASTYITDKRGSNVNAILKCHYQAQSNATANGAHNGTTWFRIRYNMNSKKITGISKILNDSNTSND